METIEYRCILVQSPSHELLALADAGGYHLPRVHIPQATRVARELQRAIKTNWALNISVLDIWAAQDGFGACLVAQLLTQEPGSHFSEVAVEQLMPAELSEEESRRLETLLEGETGSPLSHLGWVEKAIAWIRSATGHTLSSLEDIDHWNAGRGFALLRVRSDGGRYYWLKATAEPNVHEFPVTALLAELYPSFLPKVVAMMKDWNAWITEDAGDQMADPPSAAALVSAAKRMAEFQLLTIDGTPRLLAAGAFDQRLPVLRGHIDEAIGYLIEAMSRQKSTRVLPVSGDRLLELGETLHDACLRLESLGIPDALIHNDLSAGNILCADGKYVFTDWSEAAVGNPFLACERLCQLNRVHAEAVRNVYREAWKHRLSAGSMDQAMALSPFIAAYAYLHGRGDWFRDTKNIVPGFDRHARSLARHMDRAAKDLLLLEVPCH